MEVMLNIQALGMSILLLRGDGIQMRESRILREEYGNLKSTDKIFRLGTNKLYKINLLLASEQLMFLIFNS